MDASARAKLERRAVVALGVVFAVTLGNALRRGGVFAPGAGTSEPLVGGAKLQVPLPQALRGTTQAQLDALTGEAPDAAAGEALGLLPPVSEEPLYTAETFRDPLQSLLPETPEPQDSGAWAREGAAPAAAVEPPAAPSLVIQGMLWGGSEPTAIINDSVYGVGDTVQGAVIRSIDRGGILVEFHGSTWRLTPRGE